jgi:hypothetical protein
VRGGFVLSTRIGLLRAVGRGLPGGKLLSLPRGKESNQRNRAPLRRPSGSLVQAKAWGGCVTRPFGAQTVLAECPPALGLNEAAQRGQQRWWGDVVGRKSAAPYAG